VRRGTWNDFEIQLGTDPPWLLRTAAIPREEYAGTTSLFLRTQNPVPPYRRLAEYKTTSTVHIVDVNWLASVPACCRRTSRQKSRTRRFLYLCIFPTSVSSSQNSRFSNITRDAHRARRWQERMKGGRCHELHVQFSFLACLIIQRFFD
jgi:hypothetical protein